MTITMMTIGNDNNDDDNNDDNENNVDRDGG